MISVTLKLDDDLLNQARHIAVDEKKSLSAWMSEILKREVAKYKKFNRSKKSALKFLQDGFDLGGKPLSREEIYAERTW